MQSGSIIYTKLPLAAMNCRYSDAVDFGVADLHESLGAILGRSTLMLPAMRALNHNLKIAGPAVTASNFPGDNLMVQKALQLAQPGQVVVLSNGGGYQGALWGELMGTYAKQKKIAGIIVDGPIRDTAALRQMSLPIWSTYVSPSHPERRGPGSVNTPIQCAGITVYPGDIIMADDDGVIAIPPKYFAATIELAQTRVRKEARIIASLMRGEPLYELSGAASVFDALEIEEKGMSWEEDQTR